MIKTQIFKYMNMTFNVGHGHMIARNHPIEEIPHDQLQIPPFVQVDTDWAKAHADLNEPVLFATAIIDGKEYVVLIDGHHRLHRAHYEKKSLKAKFLNLRDSERIRLK